MPDFDPSQLPQSDDPAEIKRMWDATQAEHARLNPVLEAMPKDASGYQKLYKRCLWLELAVISFKGRYYWLLHQQPEYQLDFQD